MATAVGRGGPEPGGHQRDVGKGEFDARHPTIFVGENPFFGPLPGVERRRRAPYPPIGSKDAVLLEFIDTVSRFKSLLWACDGPIYGSTRGPWGEGGGRGAPRGSEATREAGRRPLIAASVSLRPSVWERELAEKRSAGSSRVPKGTIVGVESLRKDPLHGY